MSATHIEEHLTQISDTQTTAHYIVRGDWYELGINPDMAPCKQSREGYSLWGSFTMTVYAGRGSVNLSRKRCAGQNDDSLVVNGNIRSISKREAGTFGVEPVQISAALASALERSDNLIAGIDQSAFAAARRPLVNTAHYRLYPRKPDLCTHLEFDMVYRINHARRDDLFSTGFSDGIAALTRRVANQHCSQARGASIRSQIERDFGQIEFQVDETPATIDATTLDVSGQGWVDVREIRLEGAEQSLPLVWSATGNDADRWQTTLPLAPGLNEFTLQAVDYQGDVIGSHSFAVTSTVDARPLIDSLRVVELHYHPAPSRDGELAVDENEFEFIELMNTSDQPIDLNGAQFVQLPDGDGMRFTFDAQLLEPGERIVIVKNRAAFESRYGAAARVALGSDPLTPDADSVLGEYGGRLDNGGETITLQDNRGVIISQFAYQDETPWPTASDGEGPSLQRIDPSNDPNLPASWRAGDRDGTPGAGDVLSGDLNRDGRLDVADINRICAAIHAGEASAEFDLNRDQQIDLADHQFLVEALMGVPIGDANLDGRFNSNDLVYVFQQGHYNDRVPSNSTWTTGDWNCDLEFDSADWVAALQRSRYES